MVTDALPVFSARNLHRAVEPLPSGIGSLAAGSGCGPIEANTDGSVTTGSEYRYPMLPLFVYAISKVSPTLAWLVVPRSIAMTEAGGGLILGSAALPQPTRMRAAKARERIPTRLSPYGPRQAFGDKI